MNTPPTAQLLLIAVLLQLTWGLVPSASNFVIQEIPVELYISLRWTISGLIFLTVLSATEGFSWVFKRTSAWVSLLGILGYAIGSIATLHGLKIGGVANFALISSISPLLTTTVSMLVLKEKPAKTFYLALPLSVFGLVMIVAGKYQLTNWRSAFLSFGLITAAYVLEALVFVFSKRLYKEHSRVAYLAIAQVSAAAFMWLTQILYFHQMSDLSQLTSRGWTAALFVSLVACVICYYILHWLVLYIPGHRLSLFDGIHAISAIFFGSYFFHEPTNTLMFAGGATVLVGLTIGNWPARSSEPELAPTIE